MISVRGQDYWGNRLSEVCILRKPAKLPRMTPEECTKVDEIVSQIQVEKDREKFLKLVEKLKKLIAQKENRFPPDSPKKQV